MISGALLKLCFSFARFHEEAQSFASENLKKRHAIYHRCYKFNKCYFSENNDLLKILTHYLVELIRTHSVMPSSRSIVRLYMQNIYVVRLIFMTENIFLSFVCAITKLVLVELRINLIFRIMILAYGGVSPRPRKQLWRTHACRYRRRLR